MCNSKTSLTCKSISLMFYITDPSLFHRAQCSWGGYDAVCIHVNSFTWPGKFKRYFSVFENPGWIEKHTSRKWWFTECQGTSFHCLHGKPKAGMLWRSAPPPHHRLKGQGADFSHCLGQMPRYPWRSIYKLVLCIWNDCMQLLHHARRQKLSCCLSDILQHPGHLRGLHIHISSPWVDVPAAEKFHKSMAREGYPPKNGTFSPW